MVSCAHNFRKKLQYFRKVEKIPSPSRVDYYFSSDITKGDDLQQGFISTAVSLVGYQLGEVGRTVVCESHHLDLIFTSMILLARPLANESESLFVSVLVVLTVGENLSLSGSALII